MVTAIFAWFHGWNRPRIRSSSATASSSCKLRRDNVVNESVEQGLRPMTKLAAATPKDSTYGLWKTMKIR